jgi:hypothetical protein
VLGVPRPLDLLNDVGGEMRAALWATQALAS